MSGTSRKKVLVSIPTESHAERMKLEGVLAYAHEKKGERWDLEIDVGGRHKPNLDGIIAYVKSDKERREILGRRLPTVLIEDLMTPTSFSRRPDVVTLLCDHAAEGRTAADYFRERHFQNFAFVGADDRRQPEWAVHRKEGFERRLAEHGFACAAYDLGCPFPAWLKSLPKPCALFAVHDLRARQTLAALEACGISVPDEVAVLGVDDDEIICTTSSPALSSIPTFDRSLGVAAGRALNEIFAHRAKGRVIRTRHTQVITRFSTNIDALGDPFVAKVLSWARNHLDAKLNAESLAKRIGYSKHALQIRTERALGTTLGEAIRRLRLNEALQLLERTDDPVSEIAVRCGFTSTSHLGLRTKESTGLTPLAYRKRHKNG